MSDELLEKVSKKLSALIAVSLLKDIEKLSSGDRMLFLARFGLSNQEIADILGTTKATVEVLKSRARKGTK